MFHGTPSAKLSVRSAVISFTLTEDILAFSGEWAIYPGCEIKKTNDFLFNLVNILCKKVVSLSSFDLNIEIVKLKVLS